MLQKTFCRALLLAAVIGMNLALATPVLSSGFRPDEKPRAISELIILEPPQIDKWTKVRVRAVATNDGWKGRSAGINLAAGNMGILTRPSGGNVARWKGIKEGGVFETDFEIMPYMVGAHMLFAWYEDIWFNVHYLVLNDEGKMVFHGNTEDVDKIVGMPNVDDPVNRYTEEQSVKYRQLLPRAHNIKPVITKEKVTIHNRDLRFVISPPPMLGQVSKVTVTVPDHSREAGLKVTVGSQLKAELSEVSRWKNIKNDRSVVEWTIKLLEAGEEVIDVYFRPAHKSAYVYKLFFSIDDKGFLKSVKNDRYDEPVEVQP